MKRIVVCCDGTWDRPDQMTNGKPCPSNVYKLYRALPEGNIGGVEQLPHYIKGVGTGRWDHLRGGVFGFGLSKNVRKAYRWIAEHYEPGDQIFLLGFSRGAFTARSTAGFIRNCGLLRRENLKMLNEAYTFYRDRTDATNPRSDAAKEFRQKYAIEAEPSIRCIAVWDTVGALGIPLNGMRWVNAFNRRWQFHDTDLSSKVEFAFQALAIDERRNSFMPTLWRQVEGAGKQHLEQVWFAGTHSDVGGGNVDGSLADVPLKWIVERLQTECGLVFRPDGFPSRPTAEERKRPEPAKPRWWEILLGRPKRPEEGPEPMPLTNPNPLGLMSETWTGFWTIVPPYLRPVLAGFGDGERISSTARRRYDVDDSYCPRNLVPHLDTRDRFVEIPTPRTRRMRETVTASAAAGQTLIDTGAVDALGKGNSPAVRPRERRRAATSVHPMPGHRRQPDWHQRRPGRPPRD